MVQPDTGIQWVPLAPPYVGFLVVNLVLLLVGLASTAARILSRRLRDEKIWWDDYFSLAAVVSLCSSHLEESS
jgi:hypothetical protein